MSNTLAFLKEPMDFKGKIKIYPPSVKEVVTTADFGLYQSLLTLNADDIKDHLKKNGDLPETIPTPFEYLFINCYYDKKFEQLARDALKFFTHETFTFLYEQKKLIVGNLDELVLKVNSVEEIITIEEEEYFDFQNVIRACLGNKPENPPEPEDPEENPVIARIKAQARERDRIKARHNARNGISLEITLAAICCMGIGITPLNIGEMSYAAIGPIMSMMQEKEKYDIDIRSLLAGADSKKIKPKYWIRNKDKD